MDAFLIAFETVLPLFLVILVGFLFSRTGAANMHWIDILNKYALWIGFPALVIVSLMQLDSDLARYLPLIFANSAYIVTCLLLVFPIVWLFNLPLKIKQSLFLILPFGNVAYLGIPVLENAYGDEVLPIAAIIASVYVFWMLTLGLLLVELYKEKALHTGRLVKNLLKNPLLLSVFIGMAIVYFNISVPGFADKTLRFFSQSVTAVVLFSLGIFLGMQKTGNPREWVQVALYTSLAMIVLPAFFYIILRNTSLPPDEINPTILEAAMPLGLTPYALSVQYNLESKLFARIVVFATLVSIIILPLWLMVLGL